MSKDYCYSEVDTIELSAQAKAYLKDMKIKRVSDLDYRNLENLKVDLGDSFNEVFNDILKKCCIPKFIVNHNLSKQTVEMLSIIGIYEFSELKSLFNIHLNEIFYIYRDFKEVFNEIYSLYSLYGFDNLEEEKNTTLFISKSNAISLILDKPWMFINLEESLKDDIDVVDTAIGKHNGWILKYAGENAQNNKILINKAVRSNSLVFPFIKEDLKKDKEFLLSLMKGNAQGSENLYFLNFLDDSLKHDKEFVKSAIDVNGSVLQFVIEEFKDNKDFVNAAIRYRPGNYEFASERLRNDKELCLDVINKNIKSFEYAGDMLKDDIEIIMYAIQNTYSGLEFASERLKDDKNLVLYAIKNNPGALQFASERLKDNEEVVEKAIMIDGSDFRYASERLRNTPYIAFTAISKHPFSISIIGEELKKNRGFLRRLAPYAHLDSYLAMELYKIINSLES